MVVEKLHEKIPTKAEKILSQLKSERGGNLRHKNYQERNQGQTEKWKIVVKMFNLHFKRLGFERFEKTEKIEINYEWQNPAEIVQPTLF